MSVRFLNERFTGVCLENKNISNKQILELNEQKLELEKQINEVKNKIYKEQGVCNHKYVLLSVNINSKELDSRQYTWICKECGCETIIRDNMLEVNE